MTRQEMIAEHDELCRKYNETEEREILDRIGMLEIALLASEPIGRGEGTNGE